MQQGAEGEVQGAAVACHKGCRELSRHAAHQRQLRLLLSLYAQEQHGSDLHQAHRRGAADVARHGLLGGCVAEDLNDRAHGLCVGRGIRAGGCADIHAKAQRRLYVLKQNPV
jgi:hypothetical protein